MGESTSDWRGTTTRVCTICGGVLNWIGVSTVLVLSKQHWSETCRSADVSWVPLILYPSCHHHLHRHLHVILMILTILKIMKHLNQPNLSKEISQFNRISPNSSGITFSKQFFPAEPVDLNLTQHTRHTGPPPVYRTD